jgi:hypothetical protein
MKLGASCLSSFAFANLCLEALSLIHADLLLLLFQPRLPLTPQTKNDLWVSLSCCNFLILLQLKSSSSLAYCVTSLPSPWAVMFINVATWLVLLTEASPALKQFPELESDLQTLFQWMKNWMEKYSLQSRSWMAQPSSLSSLSLTNWFAIPKTPPCASKWTYLHTLVFFSFLSELSSCSKFKLKFHLFSKAVQSGKLLNCTIYLFNVLNSWKFP